MMNAIKQGIATTQFFLFGRKHFTQTGYNKHRSKYTGPVQAAAAIPVAGPAADGVDLSGRTFLVTGANQGIGKEVATYAAAKQATVYLLCRNAERAESAQNEIREQTDNDNVHVLLADVSEPTQVAAAAAEFRAKEERLDCLVCNAGALFNDRRVNSEGQEITLMSHLVCGSYQLTQLLLPALKQSSGSRVVYVASGGMYNTKFPKWEQAASTSEYTAGYDGNLAYAYAKRGQVLLAARLARDTPNVAFVSSHPGWVRTAAVDAAYGSSAKALEPMRTTWEGAEGICWLTAAPAEELENGAFYLDRLPQRQHLAGPFMTDGTFTKNTEGEVDALMEHLARASGAGEG